MSPWILLAVVAQFMLAVVAIVDKYIVTGKKAVVRPFVYAFYTALLSGAWIVIYLLGFIPQSLVGFDLPTYANVTAPSLTVISLSFLAAYSFFIALVSLFKALRHNDASDVVPVIGAISAITSFGLGYVFLGSRLGGNFIIGIVLLAVGTALVSRFRFNWQTAVTAVHSGIFFAIHIVTTKGLFNETATFDDGFFWSRIALVLVALSSLLVPRYCVKILAQTKSSGKKGGFIILGNKLLAGIATVLLLKAVELGEVEVVNALGGMQFVFIFLFVIFLGKRTPNEFGENVRSDREVIHKGLFIAIIVLGFFMLFV